MPRSSQRLGSRRARFRYGGGAGAGAERRPVEMVAGIRPQHRRHRDGRHRGRLRQGRRRSTTRAGSASGGPGRTTPSPDIDRKVHEDFWAAWKATYPNIETDYQNIDYNQLLDKLRTAILGNAAPMVVRLQILGGIEFASKGYFQELKPEDVGYPTADFWPGAMKSVMYEGVPYGIPTNNETMALDLERRHLQARRPRPREPAGDLGRRRRLLQADPRQARHRRLRPRGEAERRQHAVPLHAAALGLRRRRARRGGRRADLQDGLAQQRRRQGGAAGLLRHVRARQVGAGLGADQHPEREPGAVHRRPARHDDRASGRVREDGRPRLEGDRAPTRRWPTRSSPTCATA